MADQHSHAGAGCYDHPIVRPPALDALAQSGLTYDMACCACPLCGPSRTACFTGMHRNGICEKHTFFGDAVRVSLLFSWTGTLVQGARGRDDQQHRHSAHAAAATRRPRPRFVESLDMVPTFASGAIQEHVFAEYHHSLDPCLAGTRPAATLSPTGPLPCLTQLRVSPPTSPSR